MATTLFDLSALATEARRTGIGRYLAELGPALGRLAASDGDSTVLGLERLSWTGDADLTEDLDGAVSRLVASSRPVEGHLAWSCRRRVALARAARAAHADLVHLGHPGATPLGDLGCPRVVTCHDLVSLHHDEARPLWQDGYRSGLQRRDHRRFHSADHVIAVSETTANELVTLLGVPADKISVVYNGVDLDRWSPEPAERDADVRARYGLADRVYVLYVGTADWQKNPDGMLRALGIARKRAPELDLVLAWASGFSEAGRWRLMNEARIAGAQDAVLLLGYVRDDELAALYRGAAAQLFVSRAEGFGYPVVEAMAAGCPVITSNRSSLAEIAGEAAILCDPEAPEAIAEAIVAVAASATERRRLSSAGIGRARRFESSRMARETLEAYRRVVAA